MVLKNSLIMKAALQLVLLISLFLFPVQAEAQNKNSVQGDFEALMALYNSTQGYGVETLSSKSNLPSPSNASYPYMYIINNEIWALSKERVRGIGEWVNHGAIWKDKTGWTNMTPSTMGDAVGVEVDANGRVITLDLQKITTAPHGSGTVTTGNGVIGVLPPEIGNLSKMEWFNVKQNFFHGEIPDVFGSWTNLVRWSVGGISWELNLDRRTEWHEGDHRRVNTNNDPFTQITSGKVISSTNNFRTQLPASLGNLPNLDLIEAAHQYLIGSLPAEWGNLPAIRGIYISDIRGPSNLTLGEIPESWGNLSTLTVFQVANYHTHRRFSGQIPEGMKNWGNLANIALSRNNFTGEFPFGELSDLVYMVIDNNQFTGDFPWEAIFNGKNSRLSKFGISLNNFSGPLPQTIPEATHPTTNRPRYNLADFSVHGNSFEGNLPEWAANFHSLQIINISGNNFTGPFPAKLLDQDNLKTVYLQGNNLSGPLPDGKWTTDRIRWFYISDNNFEGEIPESWKTLFQTSDGSWNTSGTFQQYRFNNNNFSGIVPDWGKHVPWGSFQTYAFDANSYTFKDIGDVYDDLKAHFGSNWRIDKQRPFGNSQTRTMPAGEELVIDLSEFDYTGNKYRWLKNGAPLSGETSPVLVISSIDSKDEGEYRLEVTNSKMTELGIHTSRPITVKLGDDDGSGGNDDDPKPDAPVNISPSSSSTNASVAPRFEWSSTDAGSYILNARKTGSSQNVIYTEVAGTNFTPSEKLQYETTYRWRVRSVEDGEQSEWSSEWTFTTESDPDAVDEGSGDDENEGSDDGSGSDSDDAPGLPVLLSPGEDSKNVKQPVTFEWESVNADHYLLEVVHTGNGSKVADEKVTGTGYTFEGSLSPETTYSWRVHAVKNGVKGEWSPAWEFTTRKENGPKQSTPLNGSQRISKNPNLSWESDDADYYEVEVSESLTAEVVISEEVYDTLYTPQQELKGETTYQWRVRSIKEGEAGEWSEKWEFTTEPDENTELVFETELSQNYPNPFNPTTQIRFTIPESQQVSLKVYDMAGRLVANLVDNTGYPAGSHEVTFNANSLASGIYFYRFITESEIVTRKMTLMK